MTRQIPPPGFHILGRNFPRTPDIASGVDTPGQPIDGESDGDPIAEAAPNRKRKNISPEEANQLYDANSERGQKALNDAEAICQITYAPVYGDPLFLEEELGDLSVRFAHRSLRWEKMAHRTG